MAALAADPTLAEYPVSEFDPFAPEFFADRYHYYEQLRDTGPVVLLERCGVWACARYAEVRSVLADPRRTARAAASG